MPRNYVRKRPDRKLVTEEQIKKPKKLIAEGKSQRRAAEEVGISEGGLRKRLKNNNVPISLGRYKPTFNEAQEILFSEHCRKLDDMFFGLTIDDMRRLVYEFAAANNIEHRFNNTTKMAGRDWVECFLRRHPNLCLRQSAPTSLARAIGFNKIQVERFYKNLKEVYNKYNFVPSRIYNMDETGMSTVPKKTPKVISVKGKKVVGKIVSAERGITVTAVMCMNVTGHFVPPAFIYPRKRPRAELLDGCPLQSILMVSDSGFINSEIFVNWLQHFKSFAHPSEEYPVLLILDNHSSHISLEATRYARANHIVMVTLPPHGSHKLQPLDVAVHSPLKTKYAIECEKWMNQHPGRGITQYQVASLFNNAFKHVATLSNAQSGFRATGIFPFADDLFDDTDFAPSMVTDQSLQIDELIEEEQTQAVLENEYDIGELNLSPSILDNDLSQMANTLIEYEDIIDELPEVLPEKEVSIRTEELETDKLVTKKANIEDVNISLNKENVQPNNQLVTLAELSPLPQMKERKKRTTKCLKSEIVTGTPYKNQQEEKRRIEEEKRAKTARKRIKPVDFESQPSPSGIKKNHNKKRSQKPKTKGEEETVYCPICKEKFVHPPSEDWIQCLLCEKWFHEQCTAYVRGAFICDFCEDL